MLALVTKTFQAAHGQALRPARFPFGLVARTRFLPDQAPFWARLVWCMKEDQHRFLSLLGTLPGRLTAEQTGWVLVWLAIKLQRREDAGQLCVWLRLLVCFFNPFSELSIFVGMDRCSDFH